MMRVWWKCPICCHKVKAIFPNATNKDHDTCFRYQCEECHEWYVVQNNGTVNCSNQCIHYPCWECNKRLNPVQYDSDGLVSYVSYERAVNRYIRNNLKRGNWARISIKGNMHRALKILKANGGRARYNDLRRTSWTNCELQNLLIIGLVERVPKDCHKCVYRLQCLEHNKCLLRKDYLYGITDLGVKALTELEQATGKSIKVETNLSQEWMNYFEDRTW